MDGFDTGFGTHYYRQIINKDIIDDPEYLQRVMRHILAKATEHLGGGVEITDRMVEIFVFTEYEREQQQDVIVQPPPATAHGSTPLA